MKLGIKPFWRYVEEKISRTRIITYLRKNVYLNGLDFSRPHKKLILGTFLKFLLFCRPWASNLKINDEPFLRSCVANGWKNRQTSRAKFIRELCMYRGPTNYKIYKMSKNCFYTKTQVWVKISVYYKLNIIMNRNFVLGSVFGRLAISSVYKLVEALVKALMVN